MKTFQEIYFAVFLAVWAVAMAGAVVYQWPSKPEGGWARAWDTFLESTLYWLGTPILIAIVVGIVGLLFGLF